MMAILIGMALLVGLVYLTYGAGREPFGRASKRSVGVPPIVGPDIDSGSGDGPEHDAEDREAGLSRELVSGRLAPAAYQQAMTELAQSGPDRTGDPR